MEIPEDAKSLAASASPEILEAFVAAASTAFQELCGTYVTAREPFALQRVLALDVSATMCLRHDPPGQLILSFPLPTLDTLTRRYAGDAAECTPEFLNDAAGEFLNVIAGQAKTTLKETSAHYLLSMPSVNRSKNIALEGESDVITFVFDCDYGSVVLQISMPWMRLM